MVEIVSLVFSLLVPLALFRWALRIERRMKLWGFDTKLTGNDVKDFFNLHKKVYWFFTKVDYEQKKS